MYIYTYICSTINDNSNMKTETLNEYFDNRITKMKSACLGLIIGTPALVIIITEILMKAL